MCLCWWNAHKKLIFYIINKPKFSFQIRSSDQNSLAKWNILIKILEEDKWMNIFLIIRINISKNDTSAIHNQNTIFSSSADQCSCFFLKLENSLPFISESLSSCWFSANWVRSAGYFFGLAFFLLSFDPFYEENELYYVKLNIFRKVMLHKKN